ncbi:hypothetical protein ATCV1_z386R [Acanthocystis turfacea chlorella virus 1]|uniref:Uncharacterized protein z386R n=1 Tax=Chlorovirus heliozoae TaxID=322019 RepID=A7K8Z6_9PHYC|nr:hypothetical protein ATCV1_z386R [Acanthocystis turfacea chlorella virus 1]ABT16520.1 hypothetical protein ATCV1_z386R [Acanthocystis turfacea chlorella virus 1]
MRPLFAMAVLVFSAACSSSTTFDYNTYCHASIHKTDLSICKNGFHIQTYESIRKVVHRPNSSFYRRTFQTTSTTR